MIIPKNAYFYAKTIIRIGKNHQNQIAKPNACVGINKQTPILMIWIFRLIGDKGNINWAWHIIIENINIKIILKNLQ